MDFNFYFMSDVLVRVNLGIDMRSPFDFSYHNNESMVRMRYRQNNMYCVQVTLRRSFNTIIIAKRT